MTMIDVKRRSPVQFKASVVKTEIRDNWTVVLEYEHEKQGPFLVDLCHKTKWDLQDSNLAQFKPFGLQIPLSLGDSKFEEGVIINRMNHTQASIWHLLGNAPGLPEGQAYTDVSESTVFLALFGSNVFAIAEKLSTLDLLDPKRKTPFLLQGPFSHVPCQVVTLEKDKSFNGGFLMTCPRGYAQSMVHLILEAGAEFGLRPAGETKFSDWLAALGKNRQK